MHNKLCTLTIVGFAVVTAVLIFVLRQPQTPDMPATPTALPTATAKPTRAPQSIAPRRPASSAPQFLEQTESVVVHEFMDSFPEQTRPYLIRALYSMQVADQQGLRLSGSGPRLIEGLARKLFIDDYRYAARATGLLDPDDAEQVYKTLRENVDTLIDANIVDAYGPLPQYGAVETLSKLYNTMLAATHNSAYRAVWDVVASEDPTGQTDLYKDALAYAVLHSTTNEWIDQEIAKREKTWKVREQMFEGQKLIESMQNYLNLSETIVDEYQQLQNAHAVIFAERFAMRGADRELVDALRGIPVDGIGPELQIP